MSSKRKARVQMAPPPARTPTVSSRQRGRQKPPEKRILGLPARVAALFGAMFVVAVLAVVGVALLSGTAGRTATPTQYTVQATGGTWTNVNPDRLAEMLQTKDFTLVNVKTPYFAEIEKTDLFIPYDQIATQRSKLPQDRAAKILVYCRSGVESRQAAETLVSLGYTNVWNLDGGMLAWQSSGRALLYTHKP